MPEAETRRITRWGGRLTKRPLPEHDDTIALLSDDGTFVFEGVEDGEYRVAVGSTTFAAPNNISGTITTSELVAKAIAAGADTVMLGSMLAGVDVGSLGLRGERASPVGLDRRDEPGASVQREGIARARRESGAFGREACPDGDRRWTDDELRRSRLDRVVRDHAQDRRAGWLLLAPGRERRIWKWIGIGTATLSLACSTMRSFAGGCRSRG